jgi:hypothetical protein
MRRIALSALRAASLSSALLFLLSACGPPPKSVQPVVADAGLERSARSFDAPPPGRARVIIASGLTLRSVGASSALDFHYKAADIYVNDTKIGTLNALEAMVFDVAPGAYTFRWTEFGAGPEGLKRSKPSVRNLNDGGVLALSTWYDGGLIVDQRYEMRVISRDPRDLNNPPKDASAARVALKPNIMIVQPSSCPPTLCK